MDSLLLSKGGRRCVYGLVGKLGRMERRSMRFVTLESYRCWVFDIRGLAVVYQWIFLHSS